MRLFLLNLRFSLGGIIAWSGAVLAWTVVLFYFYDSLGQAEFLESYLGMIEGMPEGMKQALGLSQVGSQGLEGLLSVELYMNTEYLIWLPLLLGIYAVFFGSGLVAKDAEKGTLEFILSQPVRRYQVVAAKFAVFNVALAAVSAASVVGLLVGAALIGESLDVANLLLLHLQAYVLVLAVAAYASLFSVLYLSNGRALMVSGLITAAMYILNFVGLALGSFQWLQRASFFYYYQGLPILREGQMNIAGLALHAAFAVAALTAAVVLFERRDIIPG